MEHLAYIYQALNNEDAMLGAEAMSNHLGEAATTDWHCGSDSSSEPRATPQYRPEAPTVQAGDRGLEYHPYFTYQPHWYF